VVESIYKDIVPNLLYGNQYFTTTLNVGGGLTNSQTTGIIVASVTGLDITKPGMALINYAVPLSTTLAEWIEYSSINGSNELQGVVRGSEGFSAKAHDNGVSIAFPISESHINRLAAALSIGGVATNGVSTTLDEDDMVSNSATALVTQQSVKAYVDAKAGADGWAAAGETWVYASADDPTFTFTVAGVDLTTKYSAGMKIKLTQTTVKYFIITRVTFSTNTTITVYGGADYDLANAAITLPFYSTSRSPALFPLSRDKWMVRLTDTTDRSQGSPVASTIYNLGSLFISIPIGAWRVWYSICLQIDKTGVNGGFTGLSTGASSYSDLDLVSNVNASGAFTGNSLSKEKSISVTSKTSYFVVSSTSSSGVTTLYNRNNTTSGATLIVEAISEYI